MNIHKYRIVRWTILSLMCMGMTVTSGCLLDGYDEAEAMEGEWDDGRWHEHPDYFENVVEEQEDDAPIEAFDDGPFSDDGEDAEGDEITPEDEQESFDEDEFDESDEG